MVLPSFWKPPAMFQSTSPLPFEAAFQHRLLSLRSANLTKVCHVSHVAEVTRMRGSLKPLAARFPGLCTVLARDSNPESTVTGADGPQQLSHDPQPPGRSWRSGPRATGHGSQTWSAHHDQSRLPDCPRLIIELPVVQADRPGRSLSHGVNHPASALRTEHSLICSLSLVTRTRSPSPSLPTSLPLS